MTSDRYKLVDFGGGRKLESIAGRLVDRPSPAADGVSRQNPDLWKAADARFDSINKEWIHRSPWPAHLEVDCGSFRMPVAPTPFGHIGLFPEQQANWNWLTDVSLANDQDLIALNLFAYTGASSMALIAAGFHVAHVDAAKPNVQLARRAAQINGWQNAPIRYLVDDAAKFVAREIRRGRRYHTIVLDPPAYGHSPRGKAWRIDRDLWPLLDDCLKLIDPRNFRLLVSGHSPEVDQNDISSYLKASKIFAPNSASALRFDSGRSKLIDQHHRALDSGFYVRLQSL